MSYDDSLADYNTVPERIREFREKYPEGALRPVNPDEPFRIVTYGGKEWLIYTAAAYRDKYDRLPGIGSAQEELPGRTNFTRDSELQNAETSAWGRAIVAALAADVKRSVATMEDVRASRAREESREEESQLDAQARELGYESWVDANERHSAFDTQVRAAVEADLISEAFVAELREKYGKEARPLAADDLAYAVTYLDTTVAGHTIGERLDPAPEPEPHGYDHWLKEPLAKECELHGIATTGTKPELVARLRSWDAANRGPDWPGEMDEPPM